MGRREKSREERKSKTALSLSLHSCGYSDHPNSHLPSASLPFGLVAFYTSHILLESQGEGGFSNSIFTNGEAIFTAAWQKKTPATHGGHPSEL